MSPVAFVGYVPSLILVLADDDDLLVARRNLFNVLHCVQSLDNAGSDGYRWCRRWQPVDELLGTRTSLESNKCNEELCQVSYISVS